MAKKRVAGKSAKQAAKKATTTKKAATPKKAKEKAPTPTPAEPEAIVLDAEEEKAFDLAHSSEDVCNELELAVTQAVAQAVRKVFKQQGISLKASQAENLALALFGN
jgi:hypothetical protein